MNRICSFLPSGFKLLILLVESALNFALDLSALKLGADNLSFFNLEGVLCLFQGCLELFLLHLKTLACLLKLVDAFAALAKLVGQVGDLIWNSQTKDRIC